jgi:hypothetical protein
MITLDFTEQEAGVLREMLEGYLSDLRFEIADTEKKAFRDDLHKKEDFLKRTIGALRAA